MVPYIARKIAELHSNDGFDLSSVRVALVGAGEVTRELYESFYEKYRVKLMGNYGSTETGGLITRTTPELLDTLGNPMPGVQLKICDAHGNIVPKNETGELKVKSVGMMTGYHGNDNIFDKDGYFSMGDLAAEDEMGNIFYKGRVKLLIDVAGRKINPFEVENTLLLFEGINECAVVGYISKSGAEGIKAVIVSEHSLKKSDIIKHCSLHLSSYKIPSSIQFIDFLPRDANGKIKRSIL